MSTSTEQKLAFTRRLIDDGESDLATLALQVGWSPAYLQKKFKRAFAISPADYAAQLKLGHLKQRLRQGADVTQAWVDSGFGSSSRVYENGAAKLGMLPAQYRKGGKGLILHWTITTTELGNALIAATERGICAVALAKSKVELLDELQREFPHAMLNAVHEGEAFIAQKVRAVAALLAGQAASVDVELMGTAFQHRVWQALMRVPKGQTLSYAELAEGLGMPKAARAVARACATNRVAVLVPCHRIVRGDGTLGGYRWGLPMKQTLLHAESTCDNAS